MYVITFPKEEVVRGPFESLQGARDWRALHGLTHGQIVKLTPVSEPICTTTWCYRRLHHDGPCLAYGEV